MCGGLPRATPATRLAFSDSPPSRRYSRLIGDAADSPVIENENQFYGGTALFYKFRLGR